METHRGVTIYLLFLTLKQITDVSATDIDTYQKTKCKTQHFYHRVTLNCSHQNLTYIPKTENFVQNLIFGYNFLTNVTSGTFTNISNPADLIELQLDHNDIKNISSEALHTFTKLKYLYLSNNPIDYNNLKDFFGSLATLKFLSHLRLSDIPTITLDKDLFSLLEENRIGTLEVKFYKLTKFSMDMFRNFNNLRSLYLRDNQIVELILSKHKNLQSLYIDHNNLRVFPNFSLSGNDSDCYLPDLEVLNVQSNSIDALSPNNFKCLQKLQNLKLGGNPIKVLRNNVLSKLPNLDLLQLRYLRAGSLLIEPFAFNSTSLKKLKFGLGSRARDVFVSFNDTFKFLPNLKHLVIYRINMLEVTSEQLAGLFNPLTSLTFFSCFACQISQDPKFILTNMKSVSNIGLQGNLIKTLSGETFAKNKYLKFLNLRYNQIGHIKESALSRTLLGRLHQLDLSKNPFVCDCELEWFINWLETKPKGTRVEKYPHGYICFGPAGMSNKLLSEVTFTYRECHPWSPWIWTALIASPCTIVIAIIGILLYRNRWNIKHYIYLLRKRRRYKTIPGNDYEFDAFVAYKAEDSEWVHGRLLPVLEDEIGLKLCIHERDFKLGVFINDNIISNIDASEKMILILSNSFARSGWCMFELKVAHTKLIEEEKELVIILLEKIDAKNMKNSIKVLLNTTTYIEWTEDQVGQELFWTKLKNVLKK
ncbi:toll-like receptor 13 [Mercenaria mercenaria]|uniref:toll-like receptor 13 n=1 Tax=Mercenaria mercenaria TaxID=6596 RepID=UPI00234F6BF4|nr:toll-like receptor 13 [Mercenaria mercenaria]